MKCRCDGTSHGLARAGGGWIEVIAGSMFSGKSEELIRRLRRAQIAKRKSRSSSRAIDDRYATTQSSRTARCGSSRDNVVARASCSTRVSPTPRWSASTKDSSSTRSCRRSATRSPTRASGSSSPGSIRTISASRSSRCRSCSRSPSTSPRRWRSAWSAAARPITRSGWSPAASACSSARQGTYEARCRHCFDPRAGAVKSLPSPVTATCR